MNSGARIGLAEEVKAMFKIAWEDPEEPDKGFKYLYLTTEDYAKVANLNSVRAILIEDEGEQRYKITDIIGKDDGLGVENLRYAGLIAGETSQAYEEIVTIAMVTCRTIGIGSYVVRLGQRVIQIDNSHIILTGYAALNKVRLDIKSVYYPRVSKLRHYCIPHIRAQFRDTLYLKNRPHSQRNYKCLFMCKIYLENIFAL